jgi:quercetin dioxygenase-like cupin family protein
MTYEYAPIVHDELCEENTKVKYYHTGRIGQGFIEHDHEWEHTITCTKGSLKIYDGGQEYTVKANDDTYVFQKNIKHSVEVLEDGTEFYTIHPTPSDYPKLLALQTQE